MIELTEEQKMIRGDIADCFIIMGSDVVAKDDIGSVVFLYGIDAINATVEKMVGRGEVEGTETGGGEEALRWTGDPDRISTGP